MKSKNNGKLSALKKDQYFLPSETPSAKWQRMTYLRHRSWRQWQVNLAKAIEVVYEKPPFSFGVKMPFDVSVEGKKTTVVHLESNGFATLRAAEPMATLNGRNLAWRARPVDTHYVTPFMLIIFLDFGSPKFRK
jgi:hypothetical protein